MWQENAFSFDHTDCDSVKAKLEYILKTIGVTIKAKGGLGMIPFAARPLALEQVGPSLSNCHDWMRKIKNVFDPENSSDHTAYISPEPPQKP